MTAAGSAGLAADSSIALGEEAIVTATLQYSVTPGYSGWNSFYREYFPEAVRDVARRCRVEELSMGSFKLNSRSSPSRALIIAHRHQHSHHRPSPIMCLDQPAAQENGLAI